MSSTWKAKIGLTVLLLTQAACGAIYTSPRVRDNASAISEVDIIPFSLAAIAQANSAPYTSLPLPMAYSQTASSAGAGAQPGLPVPPAGAHQPSRVPQVHLPPTEADKPYLIGPGDKLRLVGPPMRVGPTDGESTEAVFTVRADNTINVPAIGQIDVGQMTIEEANGTLSASLRAKQMDPNLVFEVSEFSARRVVVDGAVGTPQSIPLTLQPLLLEGAIATAGGAQVAQLEFASVRLLRRGQVYLVPLSMLQGSGRPRVALQDGDSIYVDRGYDLEAAQAFFRTQVERRQMSAQLRMQALSEINLLTDAQRAALNEQREVFERRLELGSVRREYVFLAGEVERVQSIPLPFENRLHLSNILFSDVALPIATADLSQIYVLRYSQAETRMKAYHLDGKNAVNLAFAAQFEMRPNDLVFVTPQRVTSWKRTLDQLSPTIVSSLAN